MEDIITTYQPHGSVIHNKLCSMVFTLQACLLQFGLYSVFPVSGHRDTATWSDSNLY